MNRDIKKYGTLGHAPGTWESVLSLIPIPKNSAEILNAGCGKFTPEIPDYKLWHCDIRKIKKKGINFVRANLNRGIPFSSPFEGTIAMEVIEHLENPHHFLKKVTDLSTAWVIITYPNNESPTAKKLFQETGNFPWFSEKHIKKNGHITPIFSWQIEHITKKLEWKVDETKHNDPITQEIVIQRLIPKKK